jgi:hypothetical protein
MRDGLAATREAKAHTFVLMTYGVLAIDLFSLARFAECQRNLAEAIVYANACDVRFLVMSWEVYRYRLQALRGEWDDAVAGLREIVGTHGEPEKGSLRYALGPLACLLARQGADDAPATLEWARDFARRANCYPEWVSTGLAETETAWLNDRPAEADDAIARLEELTERPGRVTERGELNRLKRRLGLPHEVPPGCPPIFAAGIRGDWREAATGWEAIGAPYEQALELLARLR